MKHVHRAAAYGLEPTRQVLAWLMSEDGRRVLKAEGLPTHFDPTKLTVDALYLVIHRYSKEVRQLVHLLHYQRECLVSQVVGDLYNNDYRITAEAKVLLALIFPYAIDHDLVQPGCYFGVEATLDAMYTGALTRHAMTTARDSLTF